MQTPARINEVLLLSKIPEELLSLLSDETEVELYEKNTQHYVWCKKATAYRFQMVPLLVLATEHTSDMTTTCNLVVIQKLCVCRSSVHWVQCLYVRPVQLHASSNEEDKRHLSQPLSAHGWPVQPLLWPIPLSLQGNITLPRDTDLCIGPVHQWVLGPKNSNPLVTIASSHHLVIGP